MPSIDDNEAVWGVRYRWEERGDEWSASWGGPAMQWHGTLYPRLRAFLPAVHIVEIAPGHGRWTPFLLDHCERYTGIDLAESCVAVCEERFARDPKATFRVNDGQSLPGVGDGAADLVFSFDSLVHVEPDVIGHYLGRTGPNPEP